MATPAERSAALIGALLGAGQRVRFRARGPSMAPAIRDGDEVEVAPADPAALRPGAVVLYADAAGRLTLHRLVCRDRATGRLLLRGDAVGGYDAPVAPAQVLGRVVRVVRRSGPLADVAGPALVWPDGTAPRTAQDVTQAASGQGRPLTLRAQRDAYPPLLLAHDWLHATLGAPAAGTLALCAAGERVVPALVLARRPGLALVALPRRPATWLPLAAVPARIVRVWDATRTWPLDRWPWRALLGALAAATRWAPPLAATLRALLGLHRRWCTARLLLGVAGQAERSWRDAGVCVALPPAEGPSLEPWEQDVIVHDVPCGARVLVAGPEALRLGLALASRGWQTIVASARPPAPRVARMLAATSGLHLVVQDLRAPGLRLADYGAILLTAGLYERLLGRARRVALLRALAALLAPGGVLAWPLDDLRPQRAPLTDAVRDGALWLLGRCAGIALGPGDRLLREPTGAVASHAVGGPGELRREATAAGLAWRRFTADGAAVVGRAAAPVEAQNAEDPRRASGPSVDTAPTGRYHGEARGQHDDREALGARMRAFYAALDRPPPPRPALARARRFFAARLPARGPVLEVGCGGGHLAAVLGSAERTVVALDISPAHARAARRRYPWLRVLVGDAQALPFGDARFSGVYSHEHIEHLPDPQRGLAEQWRILAPGGRLLLVAPNLGGPLPALKYALYLLRRGQLWRRSAIDGAWLPGVLGEAIGNAWQTLGRCLGVGPAFARRTPDLSRPPQGDSDATWWCNSRDLWRMVAALGGRRRLRWAGRTGWLGPFAATVYLAAEKPADGRAPVRPGGAGSPAAGRWRG